MKWTGSIALALASCHSTFAIPAAGPGTPYPGPHSLTVKTTNGQIVGHYSSAQPRVREYLGIPYAAPPVGEGRFAAPLQYTGTATQNASSFGPRCPQTQGKPVAYPDQTPQAQRVIAAFAAQDNATMSEDCLTLNIWAGPPRSYDAPNKPVLVFFYGGRWSIGDTVSSFYSGANLANAEDVIVITLNYRINIFGFPGVGDDKNLAFLDQKLAVEWISKNVAAFGGDPNRITIFGQSSGSVAVDYYSLSNPDDSLVAGYISHSGNAFSFPTNNASEAETAWYNVSGQLGCGTSGDVLPCMRQQSFQDILTAVSKVKAPSTGSKARTQPAFQPTIDNKLVFSTADFSAKLQSGNYSKKPYMFVNNNNEAGYYKIPAYAQGNILPESDWDEFNAESFTCPNSYSAYHRAAQGVPTWLVRYFGDWSNIRLYPTSGAYHGCDVDALLGSPSVVSGLPNSADEDRLIALMQKAWAAFAADPVHGLTRLGWPRYNRNSSGMVQLALNNTPQASFAAPQKFDSVCPGLKLSWYDVS
ncbi:alpha/beta-hydrolase [Myriangium duriaei CBS 260.36]|uniref:Carboxylic ester hydrolase n=1 Tax=Myriangium duriaei CBS 260.36 TaxID=1168546 RepID=A0A9P4IWG6_9PEZI|nr:alpha/beta-hydrolase [Myriangium duriaei CBS 260.36]